MSNSNSLYLLPSREDSILMEPPNPKNNLVEAESATTLASCRVVSAVAASNFAYCALPAGFRQGAVISSIAEPPGGARSRIGSASSYASTFSLPSVSSAGTSPESPCSVGKPGSGVLASSTSAAAAAASIRYTRLTEFGSNQEWIGFIENNVFHQFVSIPRDADWSQLKESVIALLDLASDCLECTGMVLYVDRECAHFQSLLRDFMWVGFTPKTAGLISEKWVMLGMEL
ncbi:hypothetical protein CJU89_6433 [Yarrowia sp. B02]|nr:hypothetical protein CJU89_6433 [Yarrowia sp. B02]